MENIVHHFEVFHCEKSIPKFADFCTNAHLKFKNAKSCSKVIVAWAMGAKVCNFLLKSNIILISLTK